MLRTKVSNKITASDELAIREKLATEDPLVSPYLNNTLEILTA